MLARDMSPGLRDEWVAFLHLKQRYEDEAMLKAEVQARLKSR